MDFGPAQARRFLDGLIRDRGSEKRHLKEELAEKQKYILDLEEHIRRLTEEHDKEQAVIEAAKALEASLDRPEKDVHNYLLERYPELADLLKDGRKGHRPHILDAAACVVAANIEGRLS